MAVQALPEVSAPEGRKWSQKDLQRVRLLEAWWRLDVQASDQGLRRAFTDEAQIRLRHLLGKCVATLKGYGRCPGLKHRLGFTDIYRRAFFGSQRYHPFILETVVFWKDSVRANGEELLHSEATRSAAADVAAKFRALAGHLEAATRGGITPRKALEQGLRQVLVGFDAAYSHYECTYIGELIEFEGRAKRHLAEAAHALERLERCAHIACVSGRSFSEPTISMGTQVLREQLWVALGELNSRARSGRRDFSSRAIRAAECLPKDSPLQPVARGLLDAFRHVCEYLREFQGSFLMYVDPILSQNVELVVYLEALEEAWEAADSFLCSDGMVMGLECFLRFLREDAASACPWLAASFAERSPEACLALPRLLLLCVGGAGGRELVARVELVAALRLRLGGCQALRGEEQADLAKATCALLGLLCDSGLSLRDARASLFRGAALGVDCDGPGGAGTGTVGTPATRTAIELLIRKFLVSLEGLSMSLQRSTPATWNSLVGVILRCTFPQVTDNGRAVCAAEPLRL